MNVALQVVLMNGARASTARHMSLSETFNRAAGYPKPKRSLTEEFNEAAGNGRRDRDGARFKKTVDMPDGDDRRPLTPLEYAARNGERKIVEKLVDAIAEQAQEQFPHHPPANDETPVPAVAKPEPEAAATAAEEPAQEEPAATPNHAENHYEGRLKKYIKLNRQK